jgi:hypothetical protein
MLHVRSYPPYLEALFSFGNPRKRHAVLTKDALNTMRVGPDAGDKVKPTAV